MQTQHIAHAVKRTKPRRSTVLDSRQLRAHARARDGLNAPHAQRSSVSVARPQPSCAVHHAPAYERSTYVHAKAIPVPASAPVARRHWCGSSARWNSRPP